MSSRVCAGVVTGMPLRRVQAEESKTWVDANGSQRRGSAGSARNGDVDGARNASSTVTWRDLP